MSKTSIGLPRPRCLAPAGGGGGYLLNRLSGVNRVLSDFSVALPETLIGLQKWAQKPHRAAEGQPSLVGGDSIGARENTHPEAKIKGNFAPVISPCPKGPARAGGGYLGGDLGPVNARPATDGISSTRHIGARACQRRRRAYENDPGARSSGCCRRRRSTRCGRWWSWRG